MTEPSYSSTDEYKVNNDNLLLLEEVGQKGCFVTVFCFQDNIATYDTLSRISSITQRRDTTDPVIDSS